RERERGQATFNVQLLMESTESWEPGTVILKRSGPLIKQQRRSCASKRNTQRAPVLTMRMLQSK
ncbi:hypothetical protein HID58_003852, partial [Brassica napus]